MNTINHYVGMFPIATGAPVEKPLAKFFFGFFAVMLLAFTATRAEAAPGHPGASALLPSPPGCWSTSSSWAIWPATSPHYVQEAGTFFKEPDKIKVWGDNVTLISQHRHRRPDRVPWSSSSLGVWKIRRFQLLLALVPALLPVFFVIEYAGLALVLRPQPAPVGRLHRQALHAHRVRRRQGRAVLDLLLSLLGLRRCWCWSSSA